MIKAVLFDLWHTLTFHDEEGARQREQNIMEYLTSFNKDVTAEDYHRLRKKYHNDITRGRLSMSDANKRILNEVGIPASAESHLTELIDESIKDNVRVFAGVGELLASLRGLGLKLGLVTNCGDGTMEILKDVRLDFFDAYGFSNEVGERKPHPKIYLKVTRELGVGPEDCVFVSDEVDEDLVGAKELGMKTIHVRQTERAWSVFDVDPDEMVITPDASLDKVADVYNIIEGWLREN